MRTLKKILLLVCAFCLLLCAVPVTASETEDAGVKVQIAYHNLAFGNQVYILYAVDVKNAGDATPYMEFWTTDNTNRAPDKTVTASVYRALNEQDAKKYYVFGYTDLTAKQMADVIYARAGVTVEGKIYNSEIDSYSICEYAARQLGVMPDYPATENEALKTMLRSMLQYGSDAQTFFGYHTDRLAKDFYLTFGEEATPEECFKFSSPVGNTVTLTKYIGNNLTKVVIPQQLKNGNVVVAIATDAFKPEDGLTFVEEIHVPGTVKTIGNNAFIDCTQLKKVVLSEGVEEIGAGAFRECKQLQSLTIPVSVTAIGNSLLSPRESLIIYYNGTEAQLQALLEKQPYWSNGEAVTFILADGTSVVKGAQ